MEAAQQRTLLQLVYQCIREINAVTVNLDEATAPFNDQNCVNRSVAIAGAVNESMPHIWQVYSSLCELRNMLCISLDTSVSHSFGDGRSSVSSVSDGRADVIEPTLDEPDSEPRANANEA